MKNSLLIAKRELEAFFDSLIAYIVLVLFLGFSGFFTWLYGSDIFFIGQADLRGFFSIGYWTLFFFIPALTMRMIAEERKTGTIELLLTKSVTDREVILGKFLATIFLISMALVCTFPYIITISILGKLDWGATFCGYLGLLLMSAVYTSIGIFASSTTNNQIVAFLVALIVGLFFHLIFSVLIGIGGIIGLIFQQLSMQTHFESISRGVMDSSDLVYFLSMTAFGLFLAELSLSKRKIVD